MAQKAKLIEVVESSLEDNLALVARIKGRELVLESTIKMQREDWLEYGRRLSDLRKQHPGKKNDQAFGKAVKKNGLDGFDRFTRSNALWFYENSQEALQMCGAHHTSLHHPTNIRTACRPAEQDNVIDIPVQKSEGQLVRTVQPAPTPEPKLKMPPRPTNGFGREIKSAVFNDKTWEWEWDSTPRQQHEGPTEPTQSPRSWLLDYIRGTSDANITELLKAVRRIEHPDKGGNPQTAAVIGQYLENLT